MSSPRAHRLVRARSCGLGAGAGYMLAVVLTLPSIARSPLLSGVLCLGHNTCYLFGSLNLGTFVLVELGAFGGYFLPTLWLSRRLQ